jgi:hypothetical protein
MVIVRMLDALGMRRAGADVEINKLGRGSRTGGIGLDPQFSFSQI